MERTEKLHDIALKERGALGMYLAKFAREHRCSPVDLLAVIHLHPATLEPKAFGGVPFSDGFRAVRDIIALPSNNLGATVLACVVVGDEQTKPFPLWMEWQWMENPAEARPASVSARPKKTPKTGSSFDPPVRVRVIPNESADNFYAADVTFRLTLSVNSAPDRRLVMVSNESVSDSDGMEKPFGGVGDLPLMPNGTIGLWSRGTIDWMADHREFNHQMVAALNRAFPNWDVPGSLRAAMKPAKP